ncbi:MAG: RHS repeat-associated core domain-containing protein, partial [Alphaproteobacteria bacterium]|nr:RHS repeat-associated core domain-containing protein [Alphaproteobacteria bacterium]
MTVSFDHNFSGQITERTVSNASYTYAHSITVDTLFDHNGLNQITSVSGVAARGYDARGNLTSYNGRTYQYDTYNRLTSVGGTGGSMSLAYDPLGRLWQTSGASGTARYQYDGAAIIAEYNASGVMQHRWVHGPGMDEPLVRYDGSGLSNKRWLHADERGSIIAHTDSTGARVQTNTYDAYGNPGATNAGLFQYTGQVWLADAGVYHYKNRTYHAELGRFMQADPIGHSGGVNLYAYVGGDPVNFTDPWGLEAEVVCEPGDVPDGQGGCKADVIIHGTRPDNDCPPGAICIDGDGIN